MPKATQSFESQLVEYLVREYFHGDSGALAAQTQYSKQQVEYWLSGTHKPRRATLRWLLSTTIAPEFKVACEFVPVDFATDSEIHKTVCEILNGYTKSGGIYAFYDSMCALVYVGKASSNLQREIYQQLCNPLGLKFPKAVRKAPAKRWQATKYISAYTIPSVEHLDYPKHVEALFLRLAKPVGNKVLGKLSIASPPKS